ncbi:ABC transporter substrate-binding protein [Sediminivirga luteola]|uniref:Sulfonate ABC transporter substrate-binding protein n=1 Tax=Sediminivirga luteola TaxID=1774748 RepID=A0A8J2XJK1_9MICO|nr:ABC transporter substrate-binding protein [Sediminivirga luteola]GGA05782.1 sulfonate ABC transporter substrate-binding protein [Sediminivirga luteola]
MSLLRTAAARLTLALTSIGLLVLTACAAPGAQEGSGADEETTIRVGVPRTFGFLSVLWARDYQMDGYRFEYSFFPNYTDLLSALASGNVDVAEGGDVGLIQTYINTNGGVRAFAVTEPAPGAQSVLVKPDSGIESVADLAGKRVVGSTAANYYPAFVTLLEQEGLSLEDIEFVDSNPNDAIQAYVQGHVDAFISTDPATAFAQEQTDSEILAGFGDIFDNYYPYFASNQTLEDKPEAIQALTTAIADNIDWAVNNPEEYVELLAPELGFSEEALELSIGRGATGLQPIDDEFLDESQEWLQTYGEYDIVTDPDIDLREVFTTDFNDYAVPSGTAG